MAKAKPAATHAAKPGAQRKRWEVRDWNVRAAEPARRAGPATLAADPPGTLYFGGPSRLYDDGDGGTVPLHFACLKLKHDRWTINHGTSPRAALKLVGDFIRDGSPPLEPDAACAKFIAQARPAAKRNLRRTSAGLVRPPGAERRKRTEAAPAGPFAPPPEYLALFEAGLTDPRAKGTVLFLSDLEWWTPRQVAAHRPPEYQVPGIVPFAANGAPDHYAWHRGRADPRTGRVPVAFCPRDEDRAYAFAPSFLAAVYRLVLEDLAENAMAEVYGLQPERLAEAFERYAAALSPYLPREWGRTLRDFAGRPWRETPQENWGSPPYGRSGRCSGGSSGTRGSTPCSSST